MHKNWHTPSEQQILKTFNSDAEKGFQTDEVISRYKKYGPNLLSVRKNKTSVASFFKSV